MFDPWERYIVPAFPLDIHPPVVQDYVGLQATIIGCDISGFAMSVLATFSGALHHCFALKILRHGNWYENPRLWVLMVGDSSQRKTPMFNTATRPLVQYEAHQQKIYAAALQAYEQAKEQNDGKTSLPKPKLPTRHVIWDTTTEACGELLSRSPKGMFILSDEVSGWLGSMEKYHNKGGRHDRAFWLKAYDGGPFRYDRVSRGEIFVENLSVSLLGGIQPKLLAEMQGLTSDGLLQRFLPTMLGAATLAQDRPCDDEAYGRLVRELIFAKPERLIMTDDALAIMNELRRHLFDLEQTSGGFAAGFQTFVGKLHGTAGRLALILHMAHDPELGATYAVEANTMEDVRKLMLEFILPHGYEFYQQGSGTEQLRQIASWILTSGKTRIVASDIPNNIRDFRGLTLREIQEQISPLVAAGWLTPENPTPACRSWKVTPQIHTQLAERAKAERKRKNTIADLIKNAAAMRREQS